MHLYQASLGGHESREEAQWAQVPTLLLGQTEAPGPRKIIPPPPPTLPPAMYLLLC